MTPEQPTELTTTLNRIRAHDPCADGWGKLLKHLGKTAADDEPLPYAAILESNGLDDALWCCRAEPQHDRLWRLYAVWCARQVQHLMKDQRSIDALDVAERYANGQATDQELAAAREARASRFVTRRTASATASVAGWVAASEVSVAATDAALYAALDAASWRFWVTHATTTAKAIARSMAAQANAFKRLVTHGVLP